MDTRTGTLGWRRIAGWLLLCALALSGCARAKPQSVALPVTTPPTATLVATPTTAATPVAPVFRLAEPVGWRPEEEAGVPLVATVERCDAEQPSTVEYPVAVRVPNDLSIGLPSAGFDASPYASQIERLVRQTYGLAQGGVHEWTDALSVEVPARHRAIIEMRWVTTWDHNRVQVLGDGAILAEVPVGVLLSAEAQLLHTRLEPCALPGAGQATPEPTGAPPVASPTEAPGASASIALVRQYIEYLDSRQYAKAYELLHPGYRAAHPKETWQRGYAAVTDLDIRAIEAVALDAGTDEVRVGLTLTALVEGKPSYSDWTAVYRVELTPGYLPYGRSIRDIRMRTLGVG